MSLRYSPQAVIASVAVVTLLSVFGWWFFSKPGCTAVFELQNDRIQASYKITGRDARLASITVFDPARKLDLWCGTWPVENRTGFVVLGDPNSNAFGKTVGSFSVSGLPEDTPLWIEFHGSHTIGLMPALLGWMTIFEVKIHGDCITVDKIRGYR